MTADIPGGFAPIDIGGEFIGVNGPLYLRHNDARLELGFYVEERHTNRMGGCHGGMMATFCDMLLPITTRSLVPEIGNVFLPTISIHVDYLAPASLGAWVQGSAEVLHITKFLAFAHGLVTADGKLVARTSGVLKISRRLRDRGISGEAHSHPMTSL